MCKHKKTKVVQEFPNGDKIKECSACGHKFRECKNLKKRRR